MMTYFDLVYDKDHENDCKFDIYLPDVCNTGKIFIYFHGGGLVCGDKQVSYASEYTSLGIAFASANYRMYPDAVFPQYIEDAAKCVAYIKEQYPDYNEIYIGGSSAGAYLSMMLMFDKRYLAKHGIDSFSDIAGYIHDAGQPTTHFNYLKIERGVDEKAIRVDEAAPIFYIDHSYSSYKTLPKVQIFYAENDMPCRPQQTEMMLQTLKMFDYPSEKISVNFMLGCTHTSYTGNSDYINLTSNFILK